MTKKETIFNKYNYLVVKNIKILYNTSEVKGMERLQKVIANLGYTSRRKAEELIINGKERVILKIIKVTT